MSKLIKLTQGKFAIVDDEDYEWLKGFKWHVHNDPRNCYARTSERVNGKVVNTLMHRLILDAKRGDDVDHENHNGLDNRRMKIRIATKSQNNRNRIPNRSGSSKYKGVCFHKKAGKWMAGITINYHNIYLGIYHDETKAAKAYDAAAMKHFGEFAMTNAQVFGI